MDLKYFALISAILFAYNPWLIMGSDSWSAYSDTSSFRDVLNGRSYEETFGDSYDDSLFSSSLTSGSYGGSGTSSYAREEKNPIRVIQQRSDSDYGSQTGAQRYSSPAVTVRTGQKSTGGTSYGTGSQSHGTGSQSHGTGSQSYSGTKGYSQTGAKGGYSQPQTQTRQQTKGGGYSGGGGSSYTKPSYGSTKTSQQSIDNDYESGGGGGYSDIPDTGFQCLNRYYGYYADVGANCQIFHVCQPDGRKWSFWCPNGTLYHQKVQTCDWWYNVDCPSSQDYYFLNERIGVLPAQDATLHRF